MPVTKSATKALRQERRRAKINLIIRNQLKRLVKQTRKTPTAKFLNQTASVLDKAVKRKIIHKNKAARLKSRLAKLAKSKKRKS